MTGPSEERGAQDPAVMLSELAISLGYLDQIRLGQLDLLSTAVCLTIPIGVLSATRRR
jgi:hypothetical protein